ncbi:MAG: ATP synthase F1 subunit gamma [Bacteroidales bacterium]|jgi:F-type H+-transporting ATPase subunit gamma|nr:ATP synthase F1 subunit gamma [Bacteroidales bacterium]
MANLKEIRNRIASVASTQQITSAMKMVSAAKLRKSQTAIMKLRPYSTKMTEIMDKLGSSSSADMPYARKEKQEKDVLIIALTSNKGLCSTFNSSIIKTTINRITLYKEKKETVHLLSFGKRGDVMFKRIKDIDYLGSKDEVWDNLNFNTINDIAEKIMQDFINKKYDRIEIIYNKFKNAATQIITTETFLPITLNEQTDTNKNNVLVDYIFEPSKNEIIESVVPQALHTQMYKCFLDSFTSEHGARMSSMNKATDNAQSLLKELRLTYNKERQAAITNEIIEICSGANALS